MLQKLWLERLTWDDPIPEHLANNYLLFRNKLESLDNLKIPRHIICYRELRLELHGFCDSSEKAYGACIFIKSTDSLGKSYSFLLCAKSKVAPPKPVTLPRLEFCGAVILSRLTNKVKNSLNVQFNTCYLWTDSTIVLSWLKTSANLLKTFVSNRVAEIKETTSFAQWRHVPGKDNPADLVSRGRRTR
ncbi:uncharacterized protein [Diabrotica undecimpunctata]|uniref:uncharacterized protein n=1 Tax=Diabrotica undecimpunctata TaxID=50387 RepID=UPI003B63E85A